MWISGLFCVRCGYGVVLFIFAVIAGIYGIGQVYQTEYVWYCDSRTNNAENIKCIQKTRYGGTFVNTVANHYQIHSTFTQPSQWTSSTIIKLICFETIALLFVVVYGHFIFQITKMYVIYTKPKKPIYDKNNKHSGNNSMYNTCCNVLSSCLSYITSVVIRIEHMAPSRYSGTYASCVWLILLQFKRVLLQSLYLLEMGGVDILADGKNESSVVTRSPSKVLAFAFILTSNNIITAIMYFIWYKRYHFLSLRWVISIVVYESVCDGIYSLFPLFSNSFKFSSMRLDSPIEFIVIIIPLLALLYSLAGLQTRLLHNNNKTGKHQKSKLKLNSMSNSRADGRNKYISNNHTLDYESPLIEAKQIAEVEMIQQVSESLNQSEFVTNNSYNTTNNKKRLVTSDYTEEVKRNLSANYNKWKFTALIAMVFYLAFGLMIIIYVLYHNISSAHECSNINFSDIITKDSEYFSASYSYNYNYNKHNTSDWSHFWSEGCAGKLYPFFEDVPCDCSEFVLSNFENTDIIEYSFKKFHSLVYMGITTGTPRDGLYFNSSDMFSGSSNLQVLALNGYITYFSDNSDYFKHWSNLQLLIVSGFTTTSCFYNLNDSASLVNALSELKSVQSISISDALNLEYIDDAFCDIHSLIVFECNGCQVERLPDCIGSMNQLRSLSFDFSSFDNNSFPDSFVLLNNTLTNLKLYFNEDLTYIPDYFKHFKNFINGTFVLQQSPICDWKYFRLLDREVQYLINQSLACYVMDSCQSDGCTSDWVATPNCVSMCDNSDCYWQLGVCLEDCDCGYENYMYEIFYHGYCVPGCNISECEYGFGNCLGGDDNYNKNKCTWKHNEIPSDYTFEQVCGNICEPNWLNSSLFCDTSCYNHSSHFESGESTINIDNIAYCPYDASVCLDTSCEIQSMCFYYRALWNVWQLGIDGDADSPYITVCNLLLVSMPYVEDITNTPISKMFNFYLFYDDYYLLNKSMNENEAMIAFWNDITNFTVSLTDALNAKQVLYWLGPYLNLTFFGFDCWNVTRQRANQIDCGNCFTQGWNPDVTEYNSDSCYNYTN